MCLGSPLLVAMAVRAKARYVLEAAGEVDRTEGLSVAIADWRFNLRSSNTEPLLRLNVQACGDETLLARKKRGTAPPDRGLTRVASHLRRQGCKRRCSTDVLMSSTCSGATPRRTIMCPGRPVSR